MFFSIAKIAIACLVIIIPLIIFYKFSVRRRGGNAKTKLDQAKNLYKTAKDEVSDAERLIREKEVAAEQELKDADRLKEKAEATKKIIHNK